MLGLTEITYAVGAGAVGACVFSFVNVLIYRLPRHLDWVRGRSMCPCCHHTLSASDLVPVVSWFALRGRCRYCNACISARYTVIELLGVTCALICLVILGSTLTSAVAFMFAALATTIAFIDADTSKIPNGLVIATGVLAGVAYVVGAPAGVSLPDRLIGLFAVSVPLALVAMATGGFGGGDIKLMAAVGALLGWKLVLVAFFLSLLIGAGQALFLLACRGATRKTAFPFGPALCVGSFLAYLVGDELLYSYLVFFGLILSPV